MQVIELYPDMTSDEFIKAANKWDKASDCDLVLPVELTSHEIRYLHDLAMQCIPSDFAYGTLEALAEFNDAPADVLQDILDTGERSCVESVCLRNDLPDELRLKCELIAQHKKS